MDTDGHVLFTPEQSSRFWQLMALLREAAREGAAVEMQIQDLLAVGQRQAAELEAVPVPRARAKARPPAPVDLAAWRAQKPPAGGA